MLNYLSDDAPLTVVDCHGRWGARNMSDDLEFQPTTTTAKRLRDMVLPYFQSLLEEVYDAYSETPEAASAQAIGAALGCWIDQQPDPTSRGNAVEALDKMLRQIGVRIHLAETY
jgi:hypothetical protein